jgi:hypothetical protein
MSTIPAGPQVVKEFRFFSDSRFVTVVFEDETTVEFHGEENYEKAHDATVHVRHADEGSVELVDQTGKTVALVVKKNVLVEKFEA